MGVTLTSGQQGVRVIRLNRRDLGYTYGLRVGDVITHINNIPIGDHQMAINIMDRARMTSLPIRLSVRRRRRYLFARFIDSLLLF